MPLFYLPFNYLAWHYTLAWRELVTIYRNWLWFISNFFSISLVSRTLIAPWRRLGEAYPTHFNPSGFFASLVINSLMRVVGLIIRLVMLASGLAAWLFFGLFGLTIFLVWLFLPLILIATLVLGLALIIK